MKIKKWLTLSLSGALLVGGVISANAAELDYAWYAAKNPDVVAELGDSPEALQAHYEMFGRKEGREANSNDVEAKLRKLFKAEEYAALYPDVKTFYGDDAEAMFQHYISYGLLEARRPSEKVSQAVAVTLKTAVEKAMADAGIAAAPGSAQFVEIITDTIPADAGGQAVQQALAQAAPEVEKAVAEAVKETTNPTPAPSNGGGSSSSSGSSSGSTTTPEEPVVTPENAIWATLADHGGDNNNALKTALDSLNNTSVSNVMENGIKVVTIGAIEVPKHTAAGNAGENIWVGIGVPYTTGYTYCAGFAASKDAASEALSGSMAAATADGSMTVSGTEYSTFYWGIAGESNKFGYLAVKGNDETIYKYIIDFSGVTEKKLTAESTGEDEEEDTLSTPVEGEDGENEEE